MLRLAGVNECSLVDGEGTRFVLFVQGCPHHCKGCFNESTWDYGGGKEVRFLDLIEPIMKNKLITGVTYSGGEPFITSSNLWWIAWALQNKRPELTHWAFTGYTWEELLEKGTIEQLEFLEMLDVLVDGRFEEDKQDDSLIYCGSRNQRIIDVQKSLLEGEIILWKQQ